MDCLGVLEEIQRSEPLTYLEMDIIKNNVNVFQQNPDKLLCKKSILWCLSQLTRTSIILGGSISPSTCKSSIKVGAALYELTPRRIVAPRRFRREQTSNSQATIFWFNNCLFILFRWTQDL